MSEHEYRTDPVTVYNETTRTVIYGINSVEHVSAQCAALPADRVFLLTTRSLLGSDISRRVENILGNRLVGVASGVHQHVPAESLDSLISTVEAAQPDLVVTLGGGSVIDSGKAVIAALAAGCRSGAQLLEHRIIFEYPDKTSQKPYPGPFLHHIAISTTLSAAEYDGIFGYTSGGVKHLSMAGGLAPVS